MTMNKERVAKLQAEIAYQEALWAVNERKPAEILYFRALYEQLYEAITGRVIV